MASKQIMTDEIANVAKKADEEITAEEIAKVAMNTTVAANWKNLAAILDAEYFDIGRLSMVASSSGDLNVQARTMLQEWHNNHRKKATHRKLIEAFFCLGWKLQAENLFGESLVASATQGHGT